MFLFVILEFLNTLPETFQSCRKACGQNWGQAATATGPDEIGVGRGGRGQPGPARNN